MIVRGRARSSRKPISCMGGNSLSLGNRRLANFNVAFRSLRLALQWVGSPALLLEYPGFMRHWICSLYANTSTTLFKRFTTDEGGTSREKLPTGSKRQWAVRDSLLAGVQLRRLKPFPNLALSVHGGPAKKAELRSPL